MPIEPEISRPFRFLLILLALLTCQTPICQNTSASRALAALTGAQKGTVVDARIYESYAGAYELAPNFVITITMEDGKLMGEPTGQPKAELYPTSETEFYLKVVDAQVTFVKNEQGVVTQLILHQNGRNMPAKKIR